MCEIYLHSSDQHQHERLIGGERSKEIGTSLISRFDKINGVVLGFLDLCIENMLDGKFSENILLNTNKSFGNNKGTVL